MATLVLFGVDPEGRLIAQFRLEDGWQCFCVFVVKERMSLVELHVVEPTSPFLAVLVNLTGMYFRGPSDKQLPEDLVEYLDEPLPLPDDHAGITASFLRSIPLRWIVQEVHRETLHQVTDGLVGPFSHADREAFRKRVKRLPERPGNPGRAGRGDRYYAVWAGRYVEAVSVSSKPNEHLSHKHRSKSASAIRDLIHEARRRGLLTPATPGKAGGFLTPKAIALLKEGD